jgi:hypothetical protein
LTKGPVPFLENSPVPLLQPILKQGRLIGIEAGQHNMGTMADGMHQGMLCHSLEGLLRAFQFETGKPIKYGATIGQSLQTLRILSPDDAHLTSNSEQVWYLEIS